MISPGFVLHCWRKKKKEIESHTSGRFTFSVNAPTAHTTLFLIIAHVPGLERDDETNQLGLMDCWKMDWKAWRERDMDALKDDWRWNGMAFRVAPYYIILYLPLFNLFQNHGSRC